ncbi:hypothetical protein HZB94_02340 [Candidatus Falkowbacteria bacterium]|nr:hypothetical protein [Candidatus Falkowbacteria bacterium]
MGHKEIRIPFEIEGRKFEAVGRRKIDGFAVNMSWSGTGDEAFQYASGENGGAIGEEDTLFIAERRYLLPQELRRCGLATNWHPTGDPREVMYFYFLDDAWYMCRKSLDGRWYDWDLILRRVA